MLFEPPNFHEFLPMRLIYPAQVKTRTYDTDSQVSTIRELALSIKTHGLLQPIIVRPTNKGFEIVAGHRRFLACKYLRWKKIAVCIKDLSDQEAFEVQIVENIQRCSLNCIEEGQAFNAFVNHYGWGWVTNLAQWIDQNNIKVNIEKTFSLAETAEALDYQRNAHPRGKVVITM